MVHKIKGTSALKLDTIKLSKRLSKIWKSLGETAVFTIGITKKGKVDIINVQTVFDKSKRPATSDKQEKFDFSIDEEVDYIG